MKYFFDKGNFLFIGIDLNDSNNNYVVYESEEKFELKENEIMIYDLERQKPKILSGRNATEYLISCNLIDFDPISQKISEDGSVVNKTQEEKENFELQFEKIRTIQEINEITQNKIISGFVVGEYTYDTKIEDQINFLGYVNLNQDCYVRCTKDNVKDLYFNTREQILNVFNLFVEYKRNLLSSANEAKKRIKDCTTSTELNEIKNEFKKEIEKK